MANTGQQGHYILEGYYLDNNGLDGFIAPNVANLSPDAIVPDGSTITYNETTTPTPSGGSNNDVWYNQPTDALYKKVSGSWILLTNRVPNVYYQPPVQNLGDCPISGTSQVYLTSSVDYGASNNFTITFYTKDLAGNPTAVTNNMTINFSIGYTQGGVGMNTGALAVTFPLGVWTYTPADLGSYDPALGTPFGMTATVTSVSPQPNGTSHINF